MKIRMMTIEDYDEVYKLWANTTGMGMRSLDDSKEGIEKFLHRNPTSNFVATVSGEVIGVILSGHDGRRAYIYHTTVNPAFRRKTVGKALVDSVIGAMSLEGINKIALVVYEDNKLGNTFWSNMGFEARTDLTYRNKTINKNNK